MQCRNCSGNDFEQTGTGNYRCTYCGTLYYDEKQKTAVKLPGRKKLVAIAGSLIATVIIITLFIISRTANNNNHPKIETKNNYTFNNTQKLSDPQGEIISVDSIPDSIGNMYFLVMCRNSGKVAIKKPEIIVRLMSSKNEKVATGRGFAFMDNLNPGEVTPVYIIISKYPKYEKLETDFTPELPYLIPEGGVFEKKFSAEFMDVSMRQTYSSKSHEIRGKIKNTSAYKVKYVKIAAILYSSSNKATGYGSAYISEKRLDPGNFDFFNIQVHTVTTKPEYYKLFFDGSVD